MPPDATSGGAFSQNRTQPNFPKVSNFRKVETKAKRFLGSFSQLVLLPRRKARQTLKKHKVFMRLVGAKAARNVAPPAASKKEKIIFHHKRSKMSLTDQFLNKKVLIRGDRSGVFVGHLIAASPDGRQVTITEARRLWYWNGASSTDEIAMRGVSRPNDCKFPAATGQRIINDTIEIIAMTNEAWQNIQKVPTWTQH